MKDSASQREFSQAAVVEFMADYAVVCLKRAAKLVHQKHVSPSDEWKVAYNTGCTDAEAVIHELIQKVADANTVTE